MELELGCCIVGVFFLVDEIQMDWLGYLRIQIRQMLINSCAVSQLHWMMLNFALASLRGRVIGEVSRSLNLTFANRCSYVYIFQLVIRVAHTDHVPSFFIPFSSSQGSEFHVTNSTSFLNNHQYTHTSILSSFRVHYVFFVKVVCLHSIDSNFHHRHNLW
jgi:hypothetical protein